MALSSILPFFITALRENGIFIHLTPLLKQDFHGQTARQVNATKISRKPYLPLMNLGLIHFRWGFNEGL